jgi:hypothetical protein
MGGYIVFCTFPECYCDVISFSCDGGDGDNVKGEQPRGDVSMTMFPQLYNYIPTRWAVGTYITELESYDDDDDDNSIIIFPHVELWEHI